jgi:putative heme-binding domain-containing protein
MVDPGQIDRLRFTAPGQTGEYPVLCTFPGHWRTMYAVLYVVPRLEDVPAEELNPPTTTEQHGPVRPFVRKWAVEDLSADLGKAVSGRNYEAGKALFNAGSCLQCHRMCDEGGMLGPNLAELPKKLVEKKLGADYVLREIIEPSGNMEEKFRPVVILKTDGTVVTGIVLGSDARSLRIRANPQADEMTVNLDEIDGRKPATVSIMPEGLLNTFTRDEILDLLAFVIAGGDPKHPAYKK